LVDPINFENEGLSEIHALAGEYSFSLKEIPTIDIRLKVWKTSEGFTYTISHRIKTPGQATGYSSSIPFAQTEKDTVDRAISDIMFYYKPAVERGEKPSPDWLVPDTDF
jgi:hypothetical protein